MRRHTLMNARAVILVTTGLLLAGCSSSTTFHAADAGWTPSTESATFGSSNDDGLVPTNPGTPSGESKAPTGPPPGATALYNQTKSTSRAANNVHVHGSSLDQGQKTTIDIRGTLDGTNSLAVLKFPLMGNLSTLVVDRKTYLNADSVYWTKNFNAETAQKYAGKWVYDTEFSQLTDTFAIGSLLKSTLNPEMDQIMSTATVRATTVAGQPAYTLSSGRKSLTCSAGPTPYLLNVHSDGLNLTFDQWNHIPQHTDPSPAVTVLTGYSTTVGQSQPRFN